MELSAAGEFFSTLQNTEMKESAEGVIRLEHFDENVMRGVLEFTRSGSVHITHENAKDLIEAAEYFLLPVLKRAAGRLLEQTLRPSNSISIYHFAERYRCEDLVVTSREFIFSNFAAVAESQEFLHLESQQVERWICRDEIAVSSEDVVFRIILKWIEQEKSEREIKFEDLFRHVRLSFISSGYLKKNVATKKFVQGNSRCLRRVRDALKAVFPESEDRQQSPRNWSDSHLVTFTGVETLRSLKRQMVSAVGHTVLIYSGGRQQCPRYALSFSHGQRTRLIKVATKMHQKISRFQPFQMTSYQGKLCVMPSSPQALDAFRHVYYDLSSNSWRIWPWKECRMVSRNALTAVGQHMYSINTDPKSISNTTPDIWTK